MGQVDRMGAYLRDMDIPLPEEVFRVSSENSLVAWEMAKAGPGICPMDDAIADPTPQMEQVLPEQLAVTLPVWLVTHREVHTNPRIRLVFDLLAEMLS